MNNNIQTFQNKYEFPSNYSWPFFYTIQKHPETRIKQLDMWKQIFLEYCQVNKIWKISKQYFLQNIGTNISINRKLSSDSINLIFEYLVKCNAVKSFNNEYFFVLWKSIEEWQQCIYDSVIKHHRVDSLETLDYLMYDEEIKNEEYHGIDKDLLIILLKDLEKKGRCKLLMGDNNIYMGVKFVKS